MPECSWKGHLGHLRGVHIHYCPDVLGGDTCKGFIFITARVFLDRTPVMGTYGFHYCPGVLGGDTYDGLATSRHWPVHQLDVKNAFLQGDLSETVYMHKPLGFRDSTHPDYVCLLQRQGTNCAYLLLYVDDIVLTASSEILLQQNIITSIRKYATEILERAHMVSCNSNRTPVDTESKLGEVVQQVCLYMHDHWEPHFSALKRILRYVRDTLDNGLQLFSSSTTSLVAYSDADWASCPTTLRSTSEAGYRDVANAVAETCWLRNILGELHTSLSSATLVYCDNVRVLHVPSRYQYVDIFTKGLPSILFEEFRTSLSVQCSPAQTTRFANCSVVDAMLECGIKQGASVKVNHYRFIDTGSAEDDGLWVGFNYL
ncbi:ribonuclease H-like domain-containing protein [Tanacetum coccineum]